MAQKGCKDRPAGWDYMLVVAIDFGTTYSGYAFQFRHDYSKKDPTKIQTPQAWNGGKQQLMSMKTPTCLLLDRNQDIDCFGYEAETKYADHCMDGDNKEYYYFRRFKMSLQDTKNLTKHTMIQDETGKEMSAKKVFSKSIECLKQHLLDMLQNRGAVVKQDEIMWVLTVPAIWDDSAKIFMREAAVDAGITGEQLTIALEPEAASLYCQYLPVEKCNVGGKVGFSDASIGTTYMVVDLGGGTADITVHEKVMHGKLKEVFRASGGAWGGTAVDGEFLALMGKIMGGPVFAEFMRDQKYDYLDLMREFEAVKRTISAQSDAELTIKVPASLNELCKERMKKDLKTLSKIAGFDKFITFVSDKMRVKPDLIRSLFKKVTDKILHHIHKIFNSEDAGKKVSLILMVGGFSESQYVQDVMKEAFHGKNGRNVLIPHQPGISVLSGAVIYGRQPDNITSRILRFTYGAKVTPDFNPEVHDARRKFVSNNVERCDNVFAKFIEAGTEVELNHEVEGVYTTTVPFQKSFGLQIYITEDSQPKYIDEPGCRMLGNLDVDIPDPSAEERKLAVMYRFGDTELHVLAIEHKSKSPCVAKISLPE